MGKKIVNHRQIVENSWISVDFMWHQVILSLNISKIHTKKYLPIIMIDASIRERLINCNKFFGKSLTHLQSSSSLIRWREFLINCMQFKCYRSHFVTHACRSLKAVGLNQSSFFFFISTYFIVKSVMHRIFVRMPLRKLSGNIPKLHMNIVSLSIFIRSPTAFT